MSNTSQDRLAVVIADIDKANEEDPRHDIVDGVARPRELVYSERMSSCLSQIYADASETLQIAARAQHICRWQLPRAQYPTGREGYHAWRSACREHHASLTSNIMREHGYAKEDIEQVAKVIKKEQLKRDPESQALENIVGVVFAKHYLEDFVAKHQDYDEPKLINILRKTTRKMDADGQTEVAKLNLPAHITRLISIAIG